MPCKRHRRETVIEDFDVGNGDLAQRCDVAHLILHLVGQGVLLLYALPKTEVEKL